MAKTNNAHAPIATCLATQDHPLDPYLRIFEQSGMHGEVKAPLLGDLTFLVRVMAARMKFGRVELHVQSLTGTTEWIGSDRVLPGDMLGTRGGPFEPTARTQAASDPATLFRKA